MNQMTWDKSNQMLGICMIWVGNVREWCEDWRHDNYNDAPADGSAWMEEGDGIGQGRSRRGGACRFDPQECRSAHRSFDVPNARSEYIGFRLVLVRE